MSEGWSVLERELEGIRAEVKQLGSGRRSSRRSYGGLGLSLIEFAHVSEELGRSPLGHYVFNCQAPDAGNMELLHAHGTAEQKERWLAPLGRGEIRSCFAMTEPEHAGLEPGLARHHARRARRGRLRDRRPQVVHLRAPTARPSPSSWR